MVLSFVCYDGIMNYRRIYTDGYSYFLTVVTHRCKPLLVENIELLRYAFKMSKQKYVYRIDAIVVLPDHLHMIITPSNAQEYSKIISYIKRNFVYGLTVGRGALTPTSEIIIDRKHQLSSAKYKRQHSGIWQERFYEHTIRDEKDWLEKMEYIQYNPLKHGLVEDIKNWEYTSFT